MTVSDELYQQVILDHNRSPRNFRKLDDPTHEAQGLNPLCGDEYTIFLKVDDDHVIQEVAYEGHGCAISKASASLMSEELKGKSEAEARELFKEFHGMILGKEPDRSCNLGKLAVFSGVWKYPARVKCAALCWHALRSALDGENVASTEDRM
jgi:nitrogen fixation NifU-like protein